MGDEADSSIADISYPSTFLEYRGLLTILLIAAGSTLIWRAHQGHLHRSQSSSYPEDILSQSKDCQGIPGLGQVKGARSKERRRRGKDLGRDGGVKKAHGRVFDMRDKENDRDISQQSEITSTLGTITTNDSERSAIVVPTTNINESLNRESQRRKQTPKAPSVDKQASQPASIDLSSMIGGDIQEASDSESTTASTATTSISASTEASEVKPTLTENSPQQMLPNKAQSRNKVYDEDLTEGFSSEAIDLDENGFVFPTLNALPLPGTRNAQSADLVSSVATKSAGLKLASSSNSTLEHFKSTLDTTSRALEASRIELEQAQLREEAAIAEADESRSECARLQWRWNEERTAWTRREIELQTHINFLMQHVQAYAHALTTRPASVPLASTPNVARLHNGYNSAGGASRKSSHQRRNPPQQNRSTPTSPSRSISQQHLGSITPQPYIAVSPTSLSIPPYVTRNSHPLSPASSLTPSPAVEISALPSPTSSLANNSTLSILHQDDLNKILPHTRESSSSSNSSTPELWQTSVDSLTHDNDRGRGRNRTTSTVHEEWISDTQADASNTDVAASVRSQDHVNEALVDAIFHRPDTILKGAFTRRSSASRSDNGRGISTPDAIKHVEL